MKKLVLFLTVIVSTLLMTSCLGEGSNNYTDSTYVYLDEDDMGQVYGKTFSNYSPARYITSNSMITMERNTIKFMYYGWDEANGTTALLIDGQTGYADNVSLLSSEIIDITPTELIMFDRPDEENPLGFNEIGSPLYSHFRDFMNDYWVIEYAYTAKKGQTAHVEFYKREELENGEIVIDMRLILTGTPAEGASDERKGDAVALHMNPLRSMYSSENELKIRFKYFKTDGTGDPVETQLSNAITWTIGSES